MFLMIDYMIILSIVTYHNISSYQDAFTNLTINMLFTENYHPPLSDILSKLILTAKFSNIL